MEGPFPPKLNKALGGIYSRHLMLDTLDLLASEHWRIGGEGVPPWRCTGQEVYNKMLAFPFLTNDYYIAAFVRLGE